MYLKELGKEFRKLNGKKMPAEIVLIGGAAILANYGFRESTYDIDAVILASSAMKDALTLPTPKGGGFLVQRPSLADPVLHRLPKRRFPCVPRYRATNAHTHDCALVPCIFYVRKVTWFSLYGSPHNRLYTVINTS